MSLHYNIEMLQNKAQETFAENAEMDGQVKT